MATWVVWFGPGEVVSGFPGRSEAEAFAAPFCRGSSRDGEGDLNVLILPGTHPLASGEVA